MWRDKLERGASAVEYAVLITVISITTIGGISVVGDTLGQTTEKTATAIGGTQTTPPAEPEESWDDLSGYACDVTALQTNIIGRFQNDDNYAPAFLTHDRHDENVLVAEDMAVTLADPDAVKTWLACGGKPTLYLVHYWGLRAEQEMYIDGTWYNAGTPYLYNQLCYALTEPKVRGNQMIFTQSEALPEGSRCKPDTANGVVYKDPHTWLLELEAQMRADYPGTPIGVNTPLKIHDRWDAIMYSDGDDSAKFIMPDNSVLAPGATVGADAWERQEDYAH